MIEQILNYIKKINTVGVIAVFGLAFSFIALTWNIIRDLIVDKVKLDFKVEFGGFLKIRGEKKALFLKTGSMPQKENMIKDKRLLFTVVNSGRRPIMIIEIVAKYKLFSILRKKVKGKGLHIVSTELPKMLRPYEIFHQKDCKDYKQIEILFNDLKKGHIKYFFGRDTKGKHWKNSKKNTKKLLNDLKKQYE